MGLGYRIGSQKRTGKSRMFMEMWNFNCSPSCGEKSVPKASRLAPP